MELPYDPAIVLLGIYPKDTKIQIQRGYMRPHVYSSIINNSQTMERAQMTTDWWTAKEDVVYVHTYNYMYVHTYNRILFSHQQEQNLVICNSADRARKYYAKGNVNQRKTNSIPEDNITLYVN